MCVGSGGEEFVAGHVVSKSVVLSVRHTHATCIVTLAIFFAVPSFADGSSGKIADLINSYNAVPGNSNLPLPDGKALARLQAGEIVSFYREKVAGPDRERIYRVNAYLVIAQPRLPVWVATLGNSQPHVSRLTEVHLSSDEAGGALWYQFLNLPWPFADRHWVVATSKSLDLASATKNRIWEHRWSLADDGPHRSAELVSRGGVPGLDQHSYDKAIYVPANAGGWVMASLNETTTLVAVHATAELGGRIPSRWAARFVKRRLTRILGALNERAESGEVSLATPHLIYTGAGELIDAAMLRQASE